MKTFYYSIFFALMLQAFISKAQYIPFPEYSAIWIDYWHAPNGGPDGCQGIYDYQLTGDTLINLLRYCV
jgi:hypothetical protein